MTKKMRNVSFFLTGLILGLILSYSYYVGVYQINFPGNHVPHQQNITSQNPTKSNNTKAFEVLPSDAIDLTIGSLQTKNKQLNETIAQLQNTLKQLQQNSKFKTTATSTESTHKSKLKFLSTDFIKKNIPKKEYIISPELKKTLDLTPEQTEQLSELLITKSKDDIDVIKPILDELSTGSVEQMFRYGETGEISNTALEEQVNEQLEDKQYYFEQNLREILSDQQISNYSDFEIEKATKQFNRMMNRKSSFLMRLPKIETYQKDSIKQFFAETQPDLSKIKIASFNSPISMNTKTIPQDFNEKLKAYLKGLLTSEQFKAFEEDLDMNY